MSIYQHFWCRTGYSGPANWALINMAKIVCIRYPKEEGEYFHVDMEGGLALIFTGKEMNRLFKAMDKLGDTLYDEDGNIVHVSVP